MRTTALAAIVAALATTTALAQPAPTPVRTPLGTAELDAPKAVARVQVMRVDFAPGQAMPRHLHPAPVVCYVEAGAFRVVIAGRPARDVKAGEVTYEPAGTPVERFQNVAAGPGTLICDFLAGPGDTELSRLLPPR